MAQLSPSLFPNMPKPFDFLILWEECVLLQDAKVSGSNSISFLPNSLLLEFFDDDMNSYENALKMRRGIKKWLQIFFIRPTSLISVIPIFVWVNWVEIVRQLHDKKYFHFSDNFSVQILMWPLRLHKIPNKRILAGRRLSWVLKFCHHTEAHIPPTISKNQNVWAFQFNFLNNEKSWHWAVSS